MSKVVCIGNEKGGCGKSTITANLAVEGVKAGLNVLVIDADTQASSMDFRAIRSEAEDLPQFHAVSCTQNTIHKDVKSFDNFDLILIDAGGRDTATFRSAMMASDLLLIPVLPSQYDIWSTEGTIKILEEARAFKDLEALFVINQIIPNTIVSKDAQEALKDFKLPVLDSKIHSRVAFKQSISDGKGVSEFEPGGKAAGEIEAVWNDLKIKLRL